MSRPAPAPSKATAARSARSSGSLRRAMVQMLVERGTIRTEAVRRAFLAEPREHYVEHATRRGRNTAAESSSQPSLDEIYRPEAALATAFDRRRVAVSSSSAPSIMAPMLESLEVTRGMRVLEIGAGTGYNAAILDHLVGPSGKVVTIDIDPAIARRARIALATTHPGVRVLAGDGRATRARSSFDRIIATASTETIYPAWRDALADGGILVCPLQLSDYGNQAVVAFRREGDVLRSTEVMLGGFMGLRLSATADAPVPKGPQLSASEIIDGRGGPLVWLSGEGVTRLRPAARRRALATMLGPTRRRRIPAEGIAGLLYYLALRPGGAAVQLRFPACLGTGIVTSDGRGIAAITHWPGPPQRQRWGDPAADARLESLIGEWRVLGSPGLEHLEMVVRFDARRLTPHPWTTLRTSEAAIGLFWHRR